MTPTVKYALLLSLGLNAALLAAGLWRTFPAIAQEGGAGPSGTGDVNCDGVVDVSDALFILNWLFTGGDGPCALPEGPREREQIERGLTLAPVPLDLEGKDRDLVGLGGYIVNAMGDCNGCHTREGQFFSPGGDPYLGQEEMINPDNYLVGGTVFGPFTSRNLRPDPETGLPAKRTFDEFLRVIRTGEDLEGEHPQISPLLQVMPWPVYRQMSDHELRAIYEYLSALPPAGD
jgi:hypothetical protein